MPTKPSRLPLQPGGFQLSPGRLRWLVLIVLSLILGVLNRMGDKASRHDLDGIPRWIDGDSFFLGNSEVRLKGIDAPEGKQTCQRDGRSWACGDEARRELQRIVGAGPVMCQGAERDQHGRWLAVCSSGGRELNAGMVASGMAVDYGGYPRQELQARMAKRGLWSGEFERPRDWRHRNGIGLGR